MSKPKPAMSLFFLALTILGLYVLASILSFSFLMSEWHAFSNIIFWGASIILTVWNVNDYFINPEKEITNNSKTNDNYREKQKQSEDNLEAERINDLGNEAFAKGHYNESIEYFSNALQIQSNALYYHNRGDGYYKIGDLANAIKDYHKVISMNPDDNYRNIYSKIAGIYYNKEDYDKALKYYNEAIRITPELKTALYNRAVVYSKMDKIDEAIIDLESMIKDKTNNVDAYILLASFYLEKNEFDKYSYIISTIHMLQISIKDFNINEQQFAKIGMLEQLYNIAHPNVTPKPASKKEELSDYQKEMPASLKKIIETRERMKSTMAEIKRLDKEISESDYKFERVSSINEVRIGKQIWTAKNLNVDKFRNGDKIQEAKTCMEWTDCLKQKKPAFCYYENNKKYADGYGKLYNYYAIIDERGLAPEGWSIPSMKDWLELRNYIKKDDFDCTVGEALKSGNQVNSIEGGEYALDEHPRWDENMDNIGMDLYSFQAFPGGFRGADEEATFSKVGKGGYWWTNTHDDSEGYDSILLAILSVFSPRLHLDGFSERVGASIRLVKSTSFNQQENIELEADNDLPF